MAGVTNLKLGLLNTAYPGARIVLDFANGMYCVGGKSYSDVTQIPGWNTIRASEGFAETNGGEAIKFAAGAPRIVPGRGILIESSKINLVPTTDTGTATLGTPGTLPTQWAWNSAASGLTTSIIGKGIEHGLPYIDLRLNGTPTNTNSDFAFFNSTVVAAAVGSNYTGSFYIKLLDGSTSGAPYTSQVFMYDRDSGGTILDSSASAVITLTNKIQRITCLRTVSAASTAYASFKMRVSSTTQNVAMDFTVRVYCPQFELGTFASSPILTYGSAVTRAADSVYINNLDTIPSYTTTNKVTVYNAGPIDTTGITVTSGSGTVSVVNDTENLALSNLRSLVPSGRVYRLNNSASGSATTITISGTTGNTNQHSLGVYIRGGNGNIGLTSNVSQAFNASRTYVRRTVTQTPGSSGALFNISAAANQDVYFILPQLEERSTVSDPIITLGATTTTTFGEKPSPIGVLRTNKCTNYNVNPTNTTNMTKSGDANSTLTVVNDIAALTAAGLDNICTSGTVYKLDNSAGTIASYANIGGSTNLTTAHSASAYIRVTAGLGGVYVRTDQTDLQTRTANTYARLTCNNLTPQSTSETIHIRANSGSVVYFILNQLEEGSVTTNPIITAGTAVTVGDNLTIATSSELFNYDGIRRVIAGLSDGTTNNRMYVVRENSNAISWFIYNYTGNFSSSGTSGYTGARSVKASFIMSSSAAAINTGLNPTGTVIIYSDYNQPNSSTGTLAVPTRLNRLEVGSVVAGSSNYTDGYIQKIIVYGHLTSTQLLASIL